MRSISRSAEQLLVRRLLATEACPLIQSRQTQVVANSRGPQTLTKLAAEAGAKPITVKEAAHAGDVVVVTIPENNIPSLPADLFKDVPASVVVIDTGPIIRGSATAALMTSKTGCRKVSGSRSNWDVP
jgi:predicted dinucleotide-binding enzyme